MRKVLQYLKGSVFLTILAPCLMVLEVIMDLLQPTLMSQIIDVGVAAGDLGYVYRTGLWMLLVAVLGFGGGAGCSLASTVACNNFGAKLRSALFAKIQTFSFREIDKFKTSSLITRMTNDITQVQMALMMFLRMMVRAPLTCLGGVVMAMRLNLRLSTIFLVAMPVLLVAILFIVRKASPMFGVMQNKIDRVNTVMRENLLGVRVVKAFVSEDKERARFNTANTDLTDWSIRAINIIMIMWPILSLIMNVSVIAVLWFGGQMTLAGEMQVGEIMAFINYLTQILMSMMMVVMLMVQTTRAKASLGRIVEVMDTQSSIADPAQPVKPQRFDVEFRDVSFAYNATDPEPVLKHISFRAEPGQTVGIIGGTGSGKSTLIGLIPRLYDVSEGQVLIGGVDVRDMALVDLRRHIGVVMQENTLFAGTVEENLRWGSPDGSREELDAAIRDAQAYEFLSTMPAGIQSEVEQRGKNFSGGQKQRLSLARTFVKNPDILILDDSTSAVDMATEARIQRSIKTKKGMLTFIIAQRISAISDADLILVLDDGAISAMGTHRELLQDSPIYRAIAVSQLGEEALQHVG